jgi:oxygen-independent coproporphyrinogen III oxidase
MGLSGLYIHVPFCKSKCYYCDFYSETALSVKDGLVDSLLKEISTETRFLDEFRPGLRTIYFGGGTPSLLEEKDFENIFDAISASYDISSCEEITIEANPDDLNPDYIRMLRKFPFNRISIGVQSFDDGELGAINRRHSAYDAEAAVISCNDAGFDNISIDLMYGLPGQTMESFNRTVEKALSLPVKHISSYALSWEEGSVLFRKLKQGILEQASDEFLETCYFDLNRKLTAKDFVRYELSNFSLPNFESKHNSSYWDGTNYLGIGPGAHSYNGSVRRYNMPSIKDYISGMISGEPPRESEWLDNDTKYNDFIMTHLRTSKGVLLHELEHLFGMSKRYYCMNNARKNLLNGFLVYEDGRLKLNEKGLFIADSICSDLIWA